MVVILRVVEMFYGCLHVFICICKTNSAAGLDSTWASNDPPPVIFVGSPSGTKPGVTARSQARCRPGQTAEQHDGKSPCGRLYILPNWPT